MLDLLRVTAGSYGYFAERCHLIVVVALLLSSKALMAFDLPRKLLPRSELGKPKIARDA